MIAAGECPAFFVKFLMERRANLNKQDESSRTALDHAEGSLNSAVVTLLRESGASRAATVIFRDDVDDE